MFQSALLGYSWVARQATNVAALFALLMMLHVVSDVVMKIAIGRPINGTAEITAYYYMVGIVFLPLAYADIRNEHINVDAIYLVVGDMVKTTFRIVGLLASIAVFAIFAYQTGLDALRAHAIGERAMGSANVLLWPARFILPASFILILVGLLFKLMMEISGRQAQTLPEGPTQESVASSAAERRI